MNRMPLVSPALVLAVCLSAACSSSGNPDAAKTQMAFGVKAARLNLWREARFRFDRAAQNNPNDAMAHNNLAVALEGAGEFDHARLEYLRALELDQSNQYIQKNYSRFMEFYGKKKKELPKAAADAKAPAETKAPAADKPAGPTLPPVEIEPPPPGTGEPPSAAPGPGAAGPPSTSPPVPVAPNPAPPNPTPPQPPPPNGGTTGGGR